VMLNSYSAMRLADAQQISTATELLNRALRFFDANPNRAAAPSSTVTGAARANPALPVRGKASRHSPINASGRTLNQFSETVMVATIKQNSEAVRTNAI